MGERLSASGDRVRPGRVDGSRGRPPGARVKAVPRRPDDGLPGPGVRRPSRLPVLGRPARHPRRLATRRTRRRPRLQGPSQQSRKSADTRGASRRPGRVRMRRLLAFRFHGELACHPAPCTR